MQMSPDLSAFAKTGKPSIAVSKRAPHQSAHSQNPHLLNNFIRKLVAAEESELEAIYEEMVRTGLNDNASLYALFTRWVELSPHRALEAIRRLDQQYHFHHLISAWAEHDPDEVLAAVSDEELRIYSSSLIEGVASTDIDRAISLAHAHFQGWMGSQLLMELAKEEPQRAATLLDAHFNRVENEGVSASIAAAWMRQDPDAALAWANGRPLPADRQGALAGALGALLELDPERAETEIAKLPTGRARAVLAVKRAQVKANSAFSEATEWAHSLPEGLEKSMALSGLAESVSETNPSLAIDLLGEATAYNGSIDFDWQALFAKTIPAIAETDPKRAFQFLQESAVGGEARWSAARDLVEKLGSRDDIMEVLADIPAGKVQQVAVASHLRTMESSEWSEVKLFVSGLQDPRSQETFANNIVNEFIDQDPDGTITWLNTLPAKVSEPVLSNTLRQVAANDPQQAAELLDLIPNETTRVASIKKIVPYISNARVAIDLIERLPSDQVEEFVTHTYTFTKDDPKVVSTWVAGLAEGTARDTAIAGMTRALSWGGRTNSVRDHERAFHWASTMTDEAKRQGILKRIFQMWRHKNPSNASDFLQSDAVSPEDRAFLTDP